MKETLEKIKNKKDFGIVSKVKRNPRKRTSTSIAWRRFATVGGPSKGPPLLKYLAFEVED